MAVVVQYVIVVAAFGFYFAGVIRRVGLVTADSLFVYIQLLMALGTFALVDPASPVDMRYVDVLVYTFVAYLAVGAVVHLSKPIRVAQPGTVATYRPGPGTAFVLLLSIGITLAYYQAVGYSALVQGLKSSLSGGETIDVTELRLDSYSGAKYLYPGYVNQFKNVILPALAVVVMTYWVRSGKRHRLLSLGLVGLSAFALLGTGQRGAFVFAVAAVITYLYLLDRRRFRRRAVAVVLAFFIPVIGFATAVQGRGVEHVTNGGPVQTLETGLTQFQSRVLRANQESALGGWRYIAEQPVQDGAEWAQAFAGVLPGNRGSDLPNRIHEALYGSYRGTAPPSIWGSIYHNFGWPGVLVAPALLALLIGKLTRAGMRAKPRNTLEVMGIAGAFTIVGFWASDTPLYLLNFGLGAYLLLWWVGSLASLVHGARDLEPRGAVEHEREHVPLVRGGGQRRGHATREAEVGRPRHRPAARGVLRDDQGDAATRLPGRVRH